MALSLTQTEAVRRLLKPGMRVCSFGYPDIIAPLPMIEKLLGNQYPLLEARADSDIICKRHGLTYHPIPDAHSLFTLLDCQLDVWDIMQERGCEILCDLNEPMHLHNDYDIVLDVGTVEHCFNIAQAVMNMAGMVKEGGYIIHENPHSGWGNHGFYSLQPTFFHDFYSTNGFEIIECLLVARNGDRISVPLTQRFNRADPVDANIFCMAQRNTIQSFVYPQQSKYAKTAAGSSGEKLKEMANG
mgnify:FL=1